MKKYLLFIALWWTIVLDWPFWQSAVAFFYGEPNWGFIVGLGAVLGLLTVAFVRLLAFLPFRVFQIVMILLTLCGAGAYCGTLLYGVPVTPDMMRNVFVTDMHEASGYFSLKTVGMFLFASLPPVLATLFLARPIPKMRWRAVKGVGLIVASIVLALGFAAINFQSGAGFIRTNKIARYYIAPFNVIASTYRTFFEDEDPEARTVRDIVDQHPEMTVKSDRPTLFLLVVGETTRAANWELNGYKRETTPNLKKIPEVINFQNAVSCGTSTDVSVPCMFSRVGRHDYDREQILSEEPLPSLLARAGFQVEWIDNQSGCKGACYNVPERKVIKVPEDCPNDRCFDDAFFNEVDTAIKNATADKPTVLVLHMMGAHGPAYYARSPESDKLFKPECHDADLGSCSKESIVNAYDNSVRNTDRVLAGLIEHLSAAKNMNTALYYVSDHGESLGEDGLYLHGMPYLVAPSVQKEVPMVMWFSPEFIKTYSVNVDEIKAKAQNDKVSHDNLYHTMMGLLGVKGSTYESKYDLNAK